MVGESATREVIYVLHPGYFRMTFEKKTGSWSCESQGDCFFTKPGFSSIHTELKTSLATTSTVSFHYNLHQFLLVLAADCPRLDCGGAVPEPSDSKSRGVSTVVAEGYGDCFLSHDGQAALKGIGIAFFQNESLYLS